MARKRAAKKLYTLSEVSRKTGISMPTLQRYKKAFQDRIPSYGEGRKQRYPAEALKVFRQLRRESDERRGKAAKSRRSSAKSASKPSADSLLTLLQVGQMTGISYPTLLRYVRLHLDRIPHEGVGRRRRFHPEAVRVFQELREQSRRGRRGGDKPTAKTDVEAKALATRLERLEKSHRALSQQIRDLERLVKKPIKVTLVR